MVLCILIHPKSHYSIIWLLTFFLYLFIGSFFSVSLRDIFIRGCLMICRQMFVRGGPGLRYGLRSLRSYIRYENLSKNHQKSWISQLFFEIPTVEKLKQRISYVRADFFCVVWRLERSIYCFWNDHYSLCRLHVILKCSTESIPICI